MPCLNLKPTRKPVRDYFKALKKVQQLSLLHEGALAPTFANLLRTDSVFLDGFKLRHGVWEAKDSSDDLAKEVKKKFSEGYPQDNILNF